MKLSLVILLAITATAIAQGPEPAPWWQRVEETQSLALKWTGALTVILGALATLIAFIIGKVNELKARVERQSEKTDLQQQQITSIALNTTPPSGGEPIETKIVNSASDPVNTKESLR